jgi:hypothetical protein
MIPTSKGLPQMSVAEHFNIVVAYLYRLLKGTDFQGIPGGRSNTFVATDMDAHKGGRPLCGGAHQASVLGKP